MDNITLASVNVWIKTSTINNSTVFKKGNSGTVSSGEQISMQLNRGFTSNNGFDAKYNSSCSPGFGWNACYNSTSAINNNTWHMLTAVIDFDSLKFYIDGVLVSATIPPANVIDICNGGGINLGVNWNSDYDYFVGLMDDVGFWNRPLTEPEITSLYNSCTLAFSTQPSNQSLATNKTALFIVGTADPSAVFQWQTDLGVGFQNLSNVGQYNGVNNDTLTVSNTTMSNNNQPFRCIISSGVCRDTSAVAVLSITNSVSEPSSSKGHQFSIYPNPADKFLFIEADAKLIGQTYKVYDHFGKVVLSGKIGNRTSRIELTSLEEGAYILRISDSMNQWFKLIKKP